MEPGSPVIVSACLLGIACRYDGTSNLHQPLVNFLHREKLIPVPVCPEQLGGLSTPRPKAWFTRGDGKDFLDGKAQLIDEFGRDTGPAFLRGAEETLKIAQGCHCHNAVLKQRSPSCGSKQIHRDGQLVEGKGIACALLEKEGLIVSDEEQFK